MRRSLALAFFSVLLAGCGSSSSSPPAPSSATIGPAGGQISAQGVAFEIPPGALSSPTTISVTADPQAPPASYTAFSPLFHFAPDGLVFARPVTVSIAASASPPSAHVYWSRSAAPGYDALATTWAGSQASALVTHFSSGFVGEPDDEAGGDDAAPPSDAGEADRTVPDDAGTVDATMPDAADADAGVVDATTPDAADAGSTAPVDAGTPDATLPDAGDYILSGTVGGGVDNVTAQTVQISASLTITPRGADGGCGDAIVIGPRQVTAPASALPYLYSFDFGTVPASVCQAQASVTASEFDSANDALAGGGSGCALSLRAGDYCDVSMAAVTPPPPDAGADASDLLNGVITFSGTAPGPGDPGAVYGTVSLFVATIPIITGAGNMCLPVVPSQPHYVGKYTVDVFPDAGLTPYSLASPAIPLSTVCQVNYWVQGAWYDGEERQLSIGSMVPCGETDTFDGITSTITSANVTCDVGTF